MLTKISDRAALYSRHFLARSIKTDPRLVPQIQAQVAPQKKAVKAQLKLWCFRVSLNIWQISRFCGYETDE